MLLVNGLEQSSPSCAPGHHRVRIDAAFAHEQRVALGQSEVFVDAAWDGACAVNLLAGGNLVTSWPNLRISTAFRAISGISSITPTMFAMFGERRCQAADRAKPDGRSAARATEHLSVVHPVAASCRPSASARANAAPTTSIAFAAHR